MHVNDLVPHRLLFHMNKFFQDNNYPGQLPLPHFYRGQTILQNEKKCSRYIFPWQFIQKARKNIIKIGLSYYGPKNSDNLTVKKFLIGMKPLVVLRFAQ